MRRAVEAFVVECGFDDVIAGEIGLCLNEALANVMRHAYGNKLDKPIQITCEALNDGVRIELRDWGSGVTPNAMTRKEHDPMRPGGVGLIILRELMDEVSWSPQPDGMVLTMIRRNRT